MTPTLPVERRERLRHDPFPPPPDAGHGPGECFRCRRTITRHASGECHWCGDWVTQLDAATVQPGDLIYDFFDWTFVTGVSNDGQTVRIATEANPKPIALDPAATVYVSTHHRRTT